MKTIVKRSLSGLVYVLLIFVCTTNVLSDILYTYSDLKIEARYFFYVLISLFLIGSLLETAKMLKYDSIIYMVLTFALSALVYYMFSKEFFYNSFSFNFHWKYVCIIILFILAVTTLFRFPDELDTDNAKLIFTTVYLAIPFSLSLVIPASNPLTVEIFFIFLMLWISDSFAFLIGSKFGKRKLAPKISPNKSVEGFIGGMVFTILSGVVIELLNPELRGNWVVMGIIISIFAPLGDLAESKLKRMFGVKDSGNLMPGHGGVLDRLDSFIFCIPAIFTYYLILNLF